MVSFSPPSATATIAALFGNAKEKLIHVPYADFAPSVHRHFSRD
jgi:hypothetical protein